MKKSRYISLLVFISILSGYCLYLFLSHWGIHLSSDGAWYCKYALQMHHLGDYTCVAEVWPPLYPFVLNLFLYLEPLPKDAAVLLSAVTLSLSLISIFLILGQFDKRIGLSVAILLVLLSSPGFINMHLYTLSESMFVLFVLGHIYFITRHWISHKRIYFILATILLSALPLIRYIGYAAFSGPVLYIILYCGFVFRRRVVVLILNIMAMLALLALAAATLPVFKHLSGRILYFGKRTESSESFAELIQKFIHGYPQLIFVMVLVFLFILCLPIYYRKKGINPLDKSNYMIGCYSALIGLSYLGALLLSKTRYHIDPINIRLLAPLSALLCTSLFLFIYSIPAEFESMNGTAYRKTRRWVGAILTFGILSILFSIFISDTARQISEVENWAKRSYSPPYAYGFNQSVAADRFAACIRTYLGENDRIDIGGVLEYRKYWQPAHFPLTLLYTKEIFADFGWHAFKIRDVCVSPQRSQPQGRNGIDFSVYFHDENDMEKQIAFHSLPILLDHEHLQDVVLDIMEKQGLADLNLFITEPVIYKESKEAIVHNVIQTPTKLKAVSEEKLAGSLFYYHLMK